MNEQAEPIFGASVRVLRTTLGATTDAEGFFQINKVPEGSFTLEASALDAEPKRASITVVGGQTYTLNFRMSAKTAQLDELVVKGETAATAAAKQPITVATVDTRGLQSQSTDVRTLLNRVQGVKVRQTGGLGSQVVVNLNGLTGNAVRFYYDGIPVEFLGEGYGINNLPVSNIDRIEVYKGVMPARIGTDALGGGINVVTKKHFAEELNLSYQIGSFNTHRFAFDYTKDIGPKWFVNTNLNLNYSDNDYFMDVEDVRYADFGVAGVEPRRVRRFHNAYFAGMLRTTLGMSDEAKRTSFKATLSLNQGFHQLQHGVRVGYIPVAEAEFRQRGVNLHAVYRKEFDGNWTLNLTGSAGVVNSVTDDSTRAIYNWSGENVTAVRPTVFRRNGAEFLARASGADIDATNYVYRADLGKALGKAGELRLNAFGGLQRRQGADPYGLRIAGIDVAAVPNRVFKQVNAVEYSLDFWDEHFTFTSAAKHYFYFAEGIDVYLINADELPLTRSERNFFGYNAGLKYQLNAKSFVRASVEDAARIPVANELFGNLTSIGPNVFLRPERSRNVNLGTYLVVSEKLKVDLNLFARNQRDLIYLDVNDIALGTFRNRDRAKARGVEASLSGNLGKRLNYQLNVTRQEVVVDGFTNVSNRFLDGSPIPNIPTFFGNLALAYDARSPFNPDDRLSFRLFANHIDEFSFVQDGRQRNDANWLPTQNTLDAGLGYAWKKRRLSFDLEVNNLTNARVFDFISVPRPGRSFDFKIRFFTQ